MNIRDGAGREVDSYELPGTRKSRGMVSVTMVLAAGVSRAIGIEGDYFHVLTAPVDDLKVRFDDDRQTSVFQGLGFRRYYSRCEFESATGQTIEVMLGFGSVQDARATANVNVTTNIAPGNTIDNGGDVEVTADTAEQLLAADADRLYALIKNPSTNSNTFRIGSAAVTATSGIALEPGETLPYPSTAAIWAHNVDTGGGDETLVVSAVKDV